MELIKPIIKVGNSAGVLVPKEWLHGEAKVSLVVRPLNLEEEIINILKPHLSLVICIALVGSYARKEQTTRSDIDVLAVTSNISKKIKKGKYNIILISREEAEVSLKNNVLPILPMLMEAKPILNSELLEKYKKTSLNKNNLNWHFETTKSALKVQKKTIEIAELENKSISDNIVYSLMLRLREAYIVDCLRSKKQYATKNFLALLDKIGVSREAYIVYQRSKDEFSSKNTLSVSDAKRIYLYIKNLIERQEKWAEKRKS